MVDTKHLPPGTVIGWPGTVIGWRTDGRPIYITAGARITAVDDDDAAEADLEDDGDDEPDDDDDDEPDAWEPPTKDEWESERAARHAANAQAASRRKVLESLGVQYDRRTGEPKDPEHVKRLMAAAEKLRAGTTATDDDGDDDGADTSTDTGTGQTAPPEPDTSTNTAPTVDKDRAIKAAVDRAIKREVPRAEARIEATYKPVVARLALQVELAAAGWSGSSPDMALRMIDLDEVTVDGGEVSGIAEQVEDMKREFPDLFRRKPAGTNSNGRRGASSADGGDKGRQAPPGRALSWEQRVSQQLDRR